MESLLSGLRGVVVYLDGLLITGQTWAEHLKTLATVLPCLQSAGLKLRKDKCVLLAASIEYLGTKLTCKACIPLLGRWRH